MTLIVGILCTDGIVIGSDGMATFSAGNNHTICQPYPDKIEIIDNRVITAWTGEIGLQQRVNDTISTLWRSGSRPKIKNQSSVQIGRTVTEEVIKDFQKTQFVSMSFGALVALPCTDRQFCLIEFASTNFQPEIKKESNWYVAMGSGQMIADPLLGLIRKAFWQNGLPTVKEGVFAMTMVLNLGCEMSPGGVGEPIKIAVLKLGETQRLEAGFLDDTELLEHKENANAAINYFGEYRSILPADTHAEIPPTPNI